MLKELSIIVAVYNIEKYIEECLKSIEKIKNIDYELLIINDGSKDNSQKIIDNYCKKNLRVKSYIKENGGVSSARNYGLEKAKGKYVWFIDGDDLIKVDEFEKFFLEIQNEELDIAYGNYLFFKDGENLKKAQKAIKYIEKEEILDGKDFLTFVGEKILGNGSVWKNLYNVKFLKSNNIFFNPEVFKGEDLLFTLLVNLKAKKVKYFDYYFYYYRTNREDSLMNNNSEENNKKDALSRKIMAQELLKNINFFEEYKWIKKYIISSYTSYINFFKVRDLEEEKIFWSIKGIVFYKLKKKIELWKRTYIYYKYKVK